MHPCFTQRQNINMCLGTEPKTSQSLTIASCYLGKQPLRLKYFILGRPPSHSGIVSACRLPFRGPGLESIAQLVHFFTLYSSNYVFVIWIRKNKKGRYLPSLKIVYTRWAYFLRLKITLKYESPFPTKFVRWNAHRYGRLNVATAKVHCACACYFQVRGSINQKEVN